MSRLQDKFDELKSKGRPALIPGIVAGDPTLDATMDAAVALCENGADIVEIVVPFSDPIADGPTIQAAGQRALSGGVTLKKILEKIKQDRNRLPVPVVLMTYLNPVFKLGIENFGKQAIDAGIDAVILPELPVEEAGQWIEIAQDIGMGTVFLTAPDSGPERIKAIVQASTGFVYAVTRYGTTGAKDDIPEELTRQLDQIKSMSDSPVVAGFGISTPETIKKLSAHVDGLIVASALVKLMETGSIDEKISRLGQAVNNLSQAFL